SPLNAEYPSSFSLIAFRFFQSTFDKMGFESSNVIPIPVSHHYLIQPVVSGIRWPRIDLYGIRSDDLAGCEGDRPRYHIFQLSDISWPVMSHDFVQRLGIHCDRPLRTA